MRRSQFLLATQKETPAEAEIISHQLMLRAGMVRKLSSGLYTWLPLGLRVLQKISAIVRNEMNAVGGQEMMMPNIQPAELWQTTQRWEAYGHELLQITDRHKRQFCYAPTAEEVITDTIRQMIHSYKQLPIIAYQITNKFRDEIRPRFGVLRAREFMMKDAYSFHADEASFKATYQCLFDTYCRILTNLGLNFRPVSADGGNIGDGSSHEFQVLAATGEDEILYNDAGTYAANVEIAQQSDLKAGDPSPDGEGTLHSTRGIEVGHIFQLGNKYSQALAANVFNAQGEEVACHMGCYGLGVSRIVGAAIEQSHDEKGIIWPSEIAPFQLALIPIGFHQSETVKTTTEKLYQQLTEAGIEVLFDDRQERPGVMFSEADLIGLPHRFVVSERGLKNDSIEYKSRTDEQTQQINVEQAVNFIIKRRQI